MIHSDVVIVGGGLAGLAAANRCAELGLRIVVLEQGSDEQYLCNSRYAAGFLNCGYRHDIREGPEALRQAIEAQTRGFADPVLADVFASQAGTAVQWLLRHGLRLVTVYVDGNKRRGVLAPPPPNKAGLHWRGRGTDLMLRKLVASLEARGGQLMRGTRVTDLVMEGGRCRGVLANGQDEFRADAVVLADGGFQADEELLRRYISPRPERLLQRNAGTGKGSALRMALAIGAKVRGMNRFYGHLHSRDALTNPALWPNPVVDNVATTGIVVDGKGERFVDEGLGGVYIANVIAALDDPLQAVAICDSTTWEGRARQFARPPNPGLVRHGATVHKADSVEALARMAGLPEAPLKETIQMHNDAVAAGNTAQRMPPRSAQAIRPASISAAPYIAIPLCAGITYTMGGVAIDGRCRVVHESEQPIEGLYAAGSCTGGHEGGSSAGYTGGLSKALTFGWHAANCIAEALGARRAIPGSALAAEPSG
jgi:fumarate reductase flavoprotein subunit